MVACIEFLERAAVAARDGRDQGELALVRRVAAGVAAGGRTLSHARFLSTYDECQWRYVPGGDQNGCVGTRIFVCVNRFGPFTGPAYRPLAARFRPARPLWRTAPNPPSMSGNVPVSHRSRALAIALALGALSRRRSRMPDPAVALWASRRKTSIAASRRAMAGSARSPTSIAPSRRTGSPELVRTPFTRPSGRADTQFTLYLDRRWRLDDDWSAKLGVIHYEPLHAENRAGIPVRRTQCRDRLARSLADCAGMVTPRRQCLHRHAGRLQRLAARRDRLAATPRRTLQP